MCIEEVLTAATGRCQRPECGLPDGRARRSLKTSRTFKANGISGDLARSLRKECFAREMCQRFLTRRQEVEPL